MKRNPNLPCLLLAFCLLKPISGLANNAKASWPALKVTAEQSSRLGIKTRQPDNENTLLHSGLPARVIVPNEQLRILSAPLPGVIQDLRAAPGMSVRKGQALVRLSSREAAELKRDLRQTRAQAELSRQNWQREQALFREGLIPEARLQASHAAWQQAEAAATERRQVGAMIGQSSRIDAAGITLTAPIDGIVLEQNATLGQRVDAAASLYTLARIDTLWLEIQTPAELAAQLKPGLNIQTGKVRGKIITVGAAVQPATQSVLVRARLEIPQDRATLPLRPGQSVETTIELPGTAGIRIPVAALVRHAGHTVVFVAEPGGYRVKAVKVLKEGSDGLLVSGLDPGDAFVVQGGASLKALWAGAGAQ